MSASRIWPCADQFGSKCSRRRPERSADPNFQSLGMARPRLEPDPAAKESLSPLESRMQLEMLEVGDGGGSALSGAAGMGSGGQAPACGVAASP